jgi:cyclase
MRITLLSAVFVLICLSLIPLANTCAQTGVSRFPIVAQDSTARMHKVSDDVYAIIHDGATDEWPHGNTGVIVGEKSVMVIDASYLPSRAVADIKLLGKVTNKPVKYLVFTHWHFDHNNGTIAYKKQFPDIEIIAERHTADFIEINGLWWSKSVTAEHSAKRKSLALLEKNLSERKDNNGNPLTDDRRGFMDTLILNRKNELLELSGLEIVKPNRVFDEELKINLGKKQVIMKNWGPANSPFDVTIYLPREKVLFTGDILVQGPRPYTGASWPRPWAKVLGDIEKISVNAVVLGHGPVQTDHQYTRQMRELLTTTLERVEAMVRNGKTLDEIQAELNMNDLYKGVWDRGEVGKPVWNAIINMLVERAWRAVRGNG